MRNLKVDVENFSDQTVSFSNRFVARTTELNPEELRAEERYQLFVFSEIFQHARDISILLHQMKRPVKAKGFLSKRKSGVFRIDNQELKAGDLIDYWIANEEGDHFVPSRLLFNGTDYFIERLGPDVKIEGKLSRLK